VVELTGSSNEMKFRAKQVLTTPLASVTDVVCAGDCKHLSRAECTTQSFLVFPYRGLFVRRVGRDEVVAEANQLLLFNAGEEYQVRHPIEGGDACLSLTLSDETLEELIPKTQLRGGSQLRFTVPRRRVDARTQAMVAVLRHARLKDAPDCLEGETLALTLVRRAFGERTSHLSLASWGLQKLVDRAKLVLSSDPGRRWTLSDIGKEVGVSPVYLTQVFRQVEGMPLYRYHMNLRLTRALELVGEYGDLTALALDLGFSSHSHFTQTFRMAYGTSPTEFKRNLHLS
jgi:AraC-like DNA-binding protein